MTTHVYTIPADKNPFVKAVCVNGHVWQAETEVVNDYLCVKNDKCPDCGGAISAYAVKGVT